MMAAFLKIRNPFLRPDGMGKRRWAKMTTTAHADMADYWHRHYLPRHFAPNARSRYGYKPRSAEYRKRKQRNGFKGRTVQMGGQVDLVYTGDMMRSLVGRNTIKAYPTRATLLMFGPRYVTMRVYKQNQPNKAAEITAMRDDEVKKLSEIMKTSILKSNKSDSTPVLEVKP